MERMQRVNVVMISTPRTSGRMERLHREVAIQCTSLPEPHPVPIIAAPGDVDLELLRSAAAIVLLDEEDAPLQLRRIISRLTFDAVVTTVRIGGRPRSDALVLPDDVAATEVVTCLRTIVHRQQEIDRLQMELSTTARIAEGVQEEISRIDEELQMAAMVQREFLPRELPAVGNTRLAAMWRPAGYVSGDIYDVSRLDEDHIGLFLADAVGHGVPAALMTMVICRSLPTKEIAADGYHRIVPPGEALARLNRFMVSRQGRSARFATAVYAVYDTRRRVARIASAGHPSVMHLAAAEHGGEMKEIPATGGLLGIFEDERYGETEVELAPGEGLVLHSDGFEQAFPHDLANHAQRRLPNDRYRDVIESLTATAEPDEMISGVRAMLDGHGGSLHQPDDLTMICLRADATAAQDGQEERSDSIPLPRDDGFSSLAAG